MKRLAMNSKLHIYAQCWTNCLYGHSWALLRNNRHYYSNHMWDVGTKMERNRTIIFNMYWLDRFCRSHFYESAKAEFHSQN